MFELLTRSVIAVIVGLLFLTVMLCTLASETISDLAARRRTTTQLRRNHSNATQSYRSRIEEVQS